MNLQIQPRTLGDVNILDCSGKLIFGDETSYLRDMVKESLKTSRHLVLNLSKVTYVDSSGLGMIVALNASTRSLGGSLKIAGLTARVNDLLQLSRLASAFELYGTAEDAAATFNTAAGTSSPPEWVA
jgi:anti-sigma B factor antagonist